VAVVLRNLVSNAVKFSKAGTRVTIALSLSISLEEGEGDCAEDGGGGGGVGGGACWSSLFPSFTAPAKKYSPTSSSSSSPCEYIKIEVRDEGVGLDPKNLPRLFSDIVQFDANVNQGRERGFLTLSLTL
jgi:signal transduction histidine kinase